jgi:hypothetical protein
MYKLLIIFFIFSYSAFAYAYIGPGMGGGVFAAVLGVLGAILLALFGIIYYPIKRMLKNRKK